MQLVVKIYTISILYFSGIIFIFLFPPRNFMRTGFTVRKLNDTGSEIKLQEYISYKSVVEAFERIGQEDREVADVVYLPQKTHENRSIVALELRSDKSCQKSGILIVGALNGMAWGAPNAILELAQKLLYGSKYQTPYFNDYDWFLIPMANPDGVELTRTLAPLPPADQQVWARNESVRKTHRPDIWNKNVDQDKKKDGCFGTNINRNFAFHWQDDMHKTPDRCSQLFPGEKPFSTAESQAIREYLQNVGDNIKLAIHVHASFVPKKELILYPWRYSLRLPSNFRSLQSIGEYAARTARLPDGRLFRVHQSSSDLRVAGSLSDYVSGVVGTDLVYILKPYHPLYPNITDTESLKTFVNKVTGAILGLVRGWRGSTKLNTLSFFGRDVEF